MTFVISSLLLVPFLYYTSSIPDACAAPREEGWGGRSCGLSTDEKYKTCCWHEADGDMVCQTCEVDGTNCDPPTVEKGSKDILSGGRLQEPPRDLGPGGGALQEPSTDLGSKLLQKDGMVFNFPTENKTAPSEQNSGTNNNTVPRNLLKEPGKIEIPNLK